MKKKNNSVQIEGMHSVTLMILYSLTVFCHEQDIPLVVTEGLTTHKQDKDLNRVSNTHFEGRAFDFRANNLDARQISLIKNFLVGRFEKFGALVKDHNDLLRRKIIIFHGEGSNFHGHVQIDRKYYLHEVF